MIITPMVAGLDGDCFGHMFGDMFWKFQNGTCWGISILIFPKHITKHIPNMENISIVNINSWNYHGRLRKCWRFPWDFMRRWVPFGVHHDFKRWFRLVLLMGISLGYVGKLIITIAYSWVWHFEKNWIFWNLFQTVIDSGNDGALGNRNMGECSCCSKKLWE